MVIKVVEESKTSAAIVGHLFSMDQSGWPKAVALKNCVTFDTIIVATGSFQTMY
jgi:hypothetical protein